MEQHRLRVNDVSASVRGFYERNEKFRLFHGSTNSTRPNASKGAHLVDTSKLNNILSIDPASRTVLVEPNVPMDRLVEATLPYGLVPPVVMEFPGITVGGGYAGTSGESSSFKHGFFDRTITSVEMVLADGSIVICSEKEKPDLFRGAAGAVGSLGITTMVEIQLIQARKYVQTTYHPVASAAEAIEKVQEAALRVDLDYVDGIIFSKAQGAVITGRMTNDIKPGANVQTFSRAWDPWYYLHVQRQITGSSGPVTEVIPLAEYLFRYDRAGFWVAASAFKYFKFPFNRITRWFLDDFLHTRMLYKALDASGQSKQYVVQDLALPYSTAEEFIHYCDEAFNIYPLWLCPLRQSPSPTLHPHLDEYEADGKSLQPLLNIGLWGQGPLNHDAFLSLNRHLEQTLRELRGMKWGYAHHYYDEEEFWQMYNKSWYDNLREKYNATSLPNVYDKVKIRVETSQLRTVWQRLFELWPINGLYGVAKSIQSRAYLEARRSTWKSMEWPQKQKDE